MIPNLFILGAPKCGTSALANYLSEHPNVYFSDPKEPFFLCDDYPHLRKQHFLETKEDYLKLFEKANPIKHKIVGEGSTNYLRSEVAISKAINLSPQAKFIVILRNPIDVAHAFHMEQLFVRNEDVSDFKRAWYLQEERSNGKCIPESCRAPEFLQYRDISMFSGQIERFFSLVPENQRLVILQEDMKDDTKKTYDNVLNFLRLPLSNKSSFQIINSSHKHRYEFLGDLILSPPEKLQPMVWRVRNYLRKSNLSIVKSLKNYLRVASKRTPLPKSFREQLLTEYREDILRLEIMIDRDLSGWLLN